jgi:hypothetical protein
MGYDMHFPANQLGGPEKVWTITGYGFIQIWVRQRRLYSRTLVEPLITHTPRWTPKSMRYERYAKNRLEIGQNL